VLHYLNIVASTGMLITLKFMLGNGQANGRGLGCRVVVDLGSIYFNPSRTIITDNFYTCLNLANELLEKKCI